MPSPHVHYRVQRCRCGGAPRGVAVIVATTLSSWRRTTSFLMCIESDGVAANLSARQHTAGTRTAHRSAEGVRQVESCTGAEDACQWSISYDHRGNPCGQSSNGLPRTRRRQ